MGKDEKKKSITELFESLMSHEIDLDFIQTEQDELRNRKDKTISKAKTYREVIEREMKGNETHVNYNNEIYRIKKTTNSMSGIVIQKIKVEKEAE